MTKQTETKKRAASSALAHPAKRGSEKTVIPTNPLPVTLLSGFLGSGKTTLLQHILQSEHGLRIAVIVNDVGAVNIDASLIKKKYSLSQADDKVVALQNGCICCSLRGGLLEEVIRLAEKEAFDYIVIESSGISEPGQITESFDTRLTEQMSTLGDVAGGLDARLRRVLRRIIDAGGLDKFAYLDTTVTVIDAFTIYNDFHTDQLVSVRQDNVEPQDNRTISDLMVDQIEFADVILINKLDMINKRTRKQVRDLVKKLNPRAKILESTYGKIDVKEIINTKLFDIEVAQTAAGWLQDLRAMTLREVNGRKTIAPRSEREIYNVRNFVYLRQRPFHPQRLWKLLYDKFILQMEDADGENDETEGEETNGDDGGDETDEKTVGGSDAVRQRSEDVENLTPPSNEEILANKKTNPLLRNLFRSKGEFFLATRPHRAGEWSQAGAILTLTGGRPWFCTLPEEEYLVGDEKIDSLVRHDISKGGEWGDRRQELVFIGQDLNIRGLSSLLDDCLLNDEEWDAWVQAMRNSADDDDEIRMHKLVGLFEDGFPDWPEASGHEGHDHHGHDHKEGHTHVAHNHGK